MPHPFGDLRCIVSELGATAAISVRSFDATTFANGFGTSSAAQVLPTSAVVQPSTPREIRSLPELEQTKEAITIYTVKALKTSDTSAADRADEVDWDGRRYKVFVVEDWTAQTQYAKAIATRIGT